MSDQGSGVPPQGPGGTPEPAWEPVTPPPPAPGYGAGQGYPPPPPPGYPPPPPPGYPPPPAGGYPPPPPGYPPPPAGGYPPPGYPPPGYPPPGYPPPTATGLTSSNAAALSYITFIPAIIFLIMEPYSRDRFVRFHAWQCILLTAVWIVITIVYIPLVFIHILGLGWLLHLLFLLVRLGLFVLWLLAIINAAQGKKFKIPVVGDMADNLANKV